MSVLATIRKRAKLLVGIIGASLLIFVLEDAFTSGKVFFGGNENTLAVINGKKIDINKFRNDADAAIERQKEAMGNQGALGDTAQNEAVQTAFKNMLFDKILTPEYKKLGINVSDSEVTDLMLGPNPAPDIYRVFSNGHGGLDKRFIDPRTGGLNMTMVLRYVKQMNESEQARWEMIEDKIRNQTVQEKYFYLLINGIYVTDAAAKQTTDDETKMYNISYVLKRYTDLPDNTFTPNDQEIKDYYNKHSYEYYQQEESRRVDYVSFNVAPTDSDMMNIKTTVDTIYRQFKACSTAKEDSLFIMSKQFAFDYEYHKPGDLPTMIDSIMTHSEIGTMYGPYKEDNQYKIAKLLDIQELPDSIKYSQIFIPVQNQNDFDKVKPFADSIKNIATVANFADLAKANSKDGESAEKGGDMGWISRVGKGDHFPADLEHKTFFGKVGNTLELTVPQGFIIICVTDQSERHTGYQVGIVTTNIEASKETRDRVFAAASDFNGKNLTGDLFEKSVSTMNRRVVDFGENETSLAGIETPKEFIKWAYAANEGEVSNVIQSGDNKFVVAHLMQISKMGIKPLEQVKDEVKAKVIEDKKAEKFTAAMKEALSGGGNLATLAQKLSTKTDTAKELTFATYSIPSLGKEDNVIGTMSALNAGAISQPIQGTLGVYVIKVDSTYYMNKMDYRQTQMAEQQAMRRAAPNEAYNALEKKAGVVSHLGKYY